MGIIITIIAAIFGAFTMQLLIEFLGAKKAALIWAAFVLAVLIRYLIEG